MWQISGDEFSYEESTAVDAPVEVVYKLVSAIDDYRSFLSDIIMAETEPDGRCHLIIRAGPLRIEVRTQVEYEPNRRVVFRMVEGPPVEEVSGSWELSAGEDGKTRTTFRAHIKAGRAGVWLLKTAAKYVERKGGELVETFRVRAMEQASAATGTPFGSAAGRPG